MAVDIRALQQKKKTGEKKESFRLGELLQKDIAFGNPFGDKKKEHFYSDLQTLFNSGVDLRSAFDLMLHGDLKPKEKAIIEELREKVIRGSSFSAAMQSSGYFSAYEYYSVKIGEETGNLQDVLKELDQFFRKRIELKRQLIKVFSYPVFVIALSFGVVYFMMKYVVPMFGTIFKRFGGELPGMTQKVIWLSDVISVYSPWFFLFLFSLIGFLFWKRKKVWFRKNSSAFILKIPLFGDLIRKVYMARFCQSMQLLVVSRTSLTEAIEMVEQMIGFYPIETALQTIKEDLVKGKNLSDSMAKFPVFDKKMISLIKVAEEVNQLDVMFQKLTKQYSDEVDHRTATLGSIIEPMLMVVIGSIVGFILISLYLPMFNLGNTIK